MNESLESSKNEIKTDGLTMTQEELLEVRMKGKLPVIDIAGHPFYVDMRMRTLRPHDDFSTLGIPFSAFDDYSISDDVAWIPYDPQKHTIKDINPSQLTSIPQGWMIVEIPHPWKLDPFGYARECGFELKDVLKEHPIQADLKARIVPWNETNIIEAIQENKKTLNTKHGTKPSMHINLPSRTHTTKRK